MIYNTYDIILYLFRYRASNAVLRIYPKYQFGKFEVCSSTSTIANLHIPLEINRIVILNGKMRTILNPNDSSLSNGFVRQNKTKFAFICTTQLAGPPPRRDFLQMYTYYGSGGACVVLIVLIELRMHHTPTILQRCCTAPPPPQMLDTYMHSTVQY